MVFVGDISRASFEISKKRCFWTKRYIFMPYTSVLISMHFSLQWRSHWVVQRKSTLQGPLHCWERAISVFITLPYASSGAHNCQWNLQPRLRETKKKRAQRKNLQGMRSQLDLQFIAEGIPIWSIQFRMPINISNWSPVNDSWKSWRRLWREIRRCPS